MTSKARKRVLVKPECGYGDTFKLDDFIELLREQTKELEDVTVSVGYYEIEARGFRPMTAAEIETKRKADEKREARKAAARKAQETKDRRELARLAVNHAIRAYSKIDRIGVYLVGSVLERPDWRDVDVRMILDDEDFDRLFASSELWETFCYAVSGALRADTGLPIDFQVQRMTEANERHPGAGRRNSLGGGRWFAGLGDATPYIKAVPAEPPGDIE